MKSDKESVKKFVLDAFDVGPEETRVIIAIRGKGGGMTVQGPAGEVAHSLVHVLKGEPILFKAVLDEIAQGMLVEIMEDLIGKKAEGKPEVKNNVDAQSDSKH